MSDSCFKIENEYFVNEGINVMSFSDFYPEGHQAGVSLIMNGKRLLTNGDIRFEQTPGQWQPVPKQNKRVVDVDNCTITTELSYPDESKHKKGFNPMIYPDFEFNYKVKVSGEGDNIKIKVDMDKPVPERFAGKLCFNIELFPGEFFDKTWLMDDAFGTFPRQANGPTKAQKSNYPHTGTFKEDKELKMFKVNSEHYNPIIADDIIAEPYAVGKKFTAFPDDELKRFSIESKVTELKLYDGRMNHNNGWFVLSSEIPVDTTEGVVEWTISPNVVKGFITDPVIQISQVGYHTNQEKKAVIELDKKDNSFETAYLYKLTANGAVEVKKSNPAEFGNFLRYRYIIFDFSDIKEEGIYKVKYKNSESSVFKISKDIYERGVWQPVIEYFLPVQMCHMRINEKYRVWHGLCHMDDAKMAPTGYQNFDGYPQRSSTLCNYKTGEHIPGVCVGGWHDAGDFDLRIESQATESYNLALAFTEFGIDYDETTIDQNKHLVEIHEPDGKNDILQQCEHGALAVIAPYRALGRLARGIICMDLRQYVLLGDPSNMTDNEISDDDRCLFTEDNPARELEVCGQLAAISVALKGYNDELSEEALTISEALYKVTKMSENMIVPPVFDEQLDESKAEMYFNISKVFSAVELFIATGKEEYKKFILDNEELIKKAILTDSPIDSHIARLLTHTDDKDICVDLKERLKPCYEEDYKILLERGSETPYGIPYKPYIWGAGWGIQKFGQRYYNLTKAYPEIFDKNMLFECLHFVLGCHPGSNTASFASGVGTKSQTIAYCMNRADYSYIPGGVVSGTALIRPDFPELLEFPFLWQQTEYVIGGGSSDYMLLVLAARALLNN